MKIVRLILLIVFFLTSLLVLFKAPVYYFWLLAVAVTNYPLLFAAITVFLLLTGFLTKKYRILGTAFGLAALFFFLLPILRAYSISRHLKTDIDTAFGKLPVKQGTEPVFLFSRLFASDRTHKIPYRTFIYNDRDPKPLSLDFFPSSMKGRRPCIMVVHGGSWRSGSSQQLPELNSRLAAQGYSVASINYRLAPEFCYPAALEDVEKAFRFLCQNSKSLRIDTNDFVILGRSAGAQIAMMAAYTMKAPKIRGIIDYYGPADMAWGYSTPASPLVLNSRKVQEDYLGGTYSQVKAQYLASSAVFFVRPDSPATLIIHGENDVLVAFEHSRRLDEALRKKGVPHFFLKLPGDTHGFDYNINGPSGQLSTFAVEEFLSYVTVPDSGR